MSKRFAVVFEARADFELATELADRILVDSIDWLEAIWLDTNREWVRKDPDGGELSWTAIAHRARERRITIHGHFDGRPAEPDAKAAWRAIEYVRFRFDSVDAIVLVRDMDDQPERRLGFEQARAHHAAHVTVVIGCADPKRECWVLSGFDPANDDERKSLDAETQRLGFNPCSESHQLTAKNEQAKRSAKQVLEALTADDYSREQHCWHSTALSVLEERGTGNGLTAYLGEVRERLVPLITG